MKRLIAQTTLAAALTAALMTSGCITVIDANGDDGVNWNGQNAQPFEASKEACEARHGDNSNSTAFITCMAEKGWTRD
jgi:hypothetical protein